MIISASDIRFYESRAVPAATCKLTRNSVSGNFDFTGEGQTWTQLRSNQGR